MINSTSSPLFAPELLTDNRPKPKDAKLSKTIKITKKYSFFINYIIDQKPVKTLAFIAVLSYTSPRYYLR